MTCNTCKKDHAAKNEGPLNVCEMKDYLAHGGYTRDSKKGKIRAFGGDIKERFQLPTVR